MNTCPHCGKPLVSGAAFCAFCGKPLISNAAHKKNPFIPYSCPRCGAPAKPGQTHCFYCKESLVSKAAKKMSKQDRIHTLYTSPAAHTKGTCALCGKSVPDGEDYCLECRDALQSLEEEAPENKPGTHPCPGCGTPIWKSREYCPDCQKRLQEGTLTPPKEHFCRSCGTPIPSDKHYCRYCQKHSYFLPVYSIVQFFRRLSPWKYKIALVVWITVIVLVVGGTLLHPYYIPLLNARHAVYQQVTFRDKGLTFAYPKAFEGTRISRPTTEGEQTQLPSESYCFDSRHDDVVMTVTITDLPNAETDISPFYEAARKNCSYTPDTCEAGGDRYEFYLDSRSAKTCFYEYGQLLEGRYYVLQFQFDNACRTEFGAYWKQLKERFRPVSYDQMQEILTKPVASPQFKVYSLYQYDDNHKAHSVWFFCPLHFYTIDEEIFTPTSVNPDYQTMLAGTADGRTQLRVKLRDKVYPDAQTALETAPYTAEFAGGNYTVTDKHLSDNRYSIYCASNEQDLSLYEDHLMDDLYEFILEFVYPTSQKEIYQPYIEKFHQEFQFHRR